MEIKDFSTAEIAAKALEMPTEFNGKSIYILGKVTGLPYPEVQAKFAAAEALLIEEGYKVYNPLNYVHPAAEWKDAMRTCIGIVIYCNAVYCLPCWEDSKGATLEHTIAEQLGLEMIYHI